MSYFTFSHLNFLLPLFQIVILILTFHQKFIYVLLVRYLPTDIRCLSRQIDVSAVGASRAADFSSPGWRKECVDRKRPDKESIKLSFFSDNK